MANPSPVAESVYARGLRLLAELLAREAFIPQPTLTSLRKYFPPLGGVLPKELPEERVGEWLDRIEYYRGLVTQLGRSGVAPRPLLNAVKMWDRGECGRAKEMPVRRARWYQEAIVEWKQIQKANREGKPAPPPRDKTADLGERRRKVEEQLHSHPELQQTFDVEGASLKPEPGTPVSVVLAVRHGNQITSSEILIPRDCFDIALLLQTVGAAEKPQ